MHVYRVVNLFRQGLHLQLLFCQFLVQVVHFVLEVLDLSCQVPLLPDLGHVLCNSLFLLFYLSELLEVLFLALIQVTLVDLDLLSQQSGLLIPLDELGAKNVSLCHHQVILFLQSLLVLLDVPDQLMDLPDS